MRNFVTGSIERKQVSIDSSGRPLFSDVRMGQFVEEASDLGRFASWDANEDCNNTQCDGSTNSSLCTNRESCDGSTNSFGCGNMSSCQDDSIDP